MTVDLRTRYLGLELSSPIVPGASPLTGDLDAVRKLEDAGAAALVMYSLFEEQIREAALHHHFGVDAVADAHPEALSYFGSTKDVRIGPDEYLELIRRIKAAVKIPVIASLNGRTPGDWVDHAKAIAQAGADGLELNLYELATDPRERGGQVEARCLEIVHAVRAAVKMPLAVKISPFFSSIPAFVSDVDRAGANGLVLFNRFYQPDIDVENLEYTSTLELSSPSELRLRILWIAQLFGRVNGSLAVTGGVHEPLDVVKSVMAGADAVQVVSTLLHHGPGYVRKLVDGLASWMEAHEYTSVASMRGCMSKDKSPNPSALDRSNYIKLIKGWK